MGEELKKKGVPGGRPPGTPWPYPSLYLKSGSGLTLTVLVSTSFPSTLSVTL